jgi:tetratricopeptide (TPR) repeat protein
MGRQALAWALLLLGMITGMLRHPAPAQDLNRIRRVAEAQHEIVMILINKKDFTKAAEEANKIFQMKWPNDQEPVLLKELLGFSDQFRHNGQPAIALQILESNLALFKSAKSQAEIWKDKGYLLEAMGKHDKAIECFKKAIDLEGKTPRH